MSGEGGPHVGGWLLGLLLSVFTGKHNHPDGEVQVWQRSVERSLFWMWLPRQRCLDFTGVQQMVRDHLEVVRGEQIYRLKETENRLFHKCSLFFFLAI